jgi:hypothetical protein
MEVWLHALSPLAPYGAESSASRPGRFIPGKDRTPPPIICYAGGWMRWRRVKRFFRASAGNRTPVIQPVVTIPTELLGTEQWIHYFTPGSPPPSQKFHHVRIDILYSDVEVFLSSLYEGVSKSFGTESITKYKLTTSTRWEATQRVMAAKFTRLTHKIAIQLHLVAESCTICSSRSRR